VTEKTRDARLLETFARLADTLVADYDVVDLLQMLVDSCHELLDASAAGILLADQDGLLELVASTSEASRLVEMMQLGADAGPCIESFRTGELVSVPDIGSVRTEWARFRDSALEQGFAAIYAIPLRLREETIGTLNLFRFSSGELNPQDLIAARAFGDVATIGILHERSLRESEIVREQLQNALSSRILIEQAKGIIAYVRNVSVDEAFTIIRDHARSSHSGIGALAAQIVNRSLVL
jgi:GAF domain-containing protein